MIILYLGARGKGKTLTMVKDGYKFYQNGYDVYRNFSCTFGKYMDNEEIISLNKLSEIKNAVLLIDEIQIFFDSRRSNRNQNLHFSNFIQQIRKRNINILCTTQYAGTVDLRLKQHLDYIAYPKYEDKFKVCEVLYKDMGSIEDSVFTGVIKEPVQEIIVYNAKPIFKLYDTSEMIV
jgi:hypothetical protein